MPRIVEDTLDHGLKCQLLVTIRRDVSTILATKFKLDIDEVIFSDICVDIMSTLQRAHEDYVVDFVGGINLLDIILIRKEP